MDEKAEDILGGLKEQIAFFDQIGVSFVSRPDVPLSLIERINTCTLCGLSRTRSHAVPGEGDPHARLMFVGEGPGRDEDLQGRPFVGRAGQLLTKIIQAMKYSREEVYITNIVKCRPPDNRNPRSEEIEMCVPYLEEQIRSIQPEVIVSLGKVATDFFVPGGRGISSLRGKFQLFRDIPVMPTFHPSYLVRNLDNKPLKRLVWQDMKLVLTRLDKN